MRLADKIGFGESAIDFVLSGGVQLILRFGLKIACIMTLVKLCFWTARNSIDHATAFYRGSILKLF